MPSPQNAHEISAMMDSSPGAIGCATSSPTAYRRRMACPPAGPALAAGSETVGLHPARGTCVGELLLALLGGQARLVRRRRLDGRERRCMPVAGAAVPFARYLHGLALFCHDGVSSCSVSRFAGFDVGSGSNCPRSA